MDLRKLIGGLTGVVYQQARNVQIGRFLRESHFVQEVSDLSEKFRLGRQREKSRHLCEGLQSSLMQDDAKVTRAGPIYLCKDTPVFSAIVRLCNDLGNEDRYVSRLDTRN